MPVLKYYYDVLSQPARAVYIFLKLTKIPFEPHLVGLGKLEHLTDEFKQNLNRFQKIPFIHHGDFKLAESVAIVGYLSREYRNLVPDYLYPSDSKAQARVDEYLNWQHMNTRLCCASYFMYKWLLPLRTKSPPDQDKVEEAKSRMLSCLDEIEELWLGQGHKYITGNTVSVADIFAASELEQPRLAGFDPTEGRPVLKAWLDSVKKDCNPYYDEAHIVLNKIVNKQKAKL
ncbi:hypothetical protein ABEB36_003533 [Hypothenemus hampei]|uniref:glutathione transferase n=1 Tax=Hypothenemus hampei TaxID=57062 RepID=A0ABD1FA66_HYPHA